MPEKINVAFNVQVVGGPSISYSKPRIVQAYEKINVSIDPGAGTEVEVQPSDAGKVELLIITCSHYGSEVKYSVKNSNPAKVDLDAPHLLIGTGAISLLGTAPKILIFDNSLADPVSIEILVGRQAKKEPTP